MTSLTKNPHSPSKKIFFECRLEDLSNRIYLNKDWRCVILREIDFLLKIRWSIPCLHPSWKVHTWIEICASLNHRKKTKADGSRLIPRKHTETLVLLSVVNATAQILATGPDLSCVVIHKRHRENRETISIVKPQKFSPYFAWLITFRCMCDVIIAPRIASKAANKFCWKNLSRQVSLLESLWFEKSCVCSVLFEVTANYLFSKYCLQALIFKIPAFYWPLLNKHTGLKKRKNKCCCLW